ncbi:uncharacterized protein LOC132553263 [Ylistrum balloti]|uniref:uncharacterized protein LOC132553263 n=1 Tax=Ylistrum balloti TaxID=509963 RepID=UPI002905F5F6|nr:uncharacterized protein LOC132553263 [Ylistrum balloti]
MNISQEQLSSYLLQVNWEDFISNGIPSIVILSLIAIVGTFGNLITCLVSFFRKQSSTHQTLVMFLAAIDLCSCTISIPLSVLWVRYPYAFTSSEVCKISRFLFIFLASCSYAVLDLIALEHYGKVVWTPEKQLTPIQAKVICTLVFIFCGVAVAFPAFYVFGITERTTPMQHLNGFECSVLAEQRGTLFLSLYLYFCILFLLFAYGCCFVLYGLIGRRFIILSRSRKLQPPEAFPKSSLSGNTMVVASDFSVSCNESEKCNYSQKNNHAQQVTVSVPEIKVTYDENEGSALPLTAVSYSDAHNYKNSNTLSENSISSQQESPGQCLAISIQNASNPLMCDVVSVNKPTLSLSSTGETNKCPSNTLSTSLSGQDFSESTSLQPTAVDNSNCDRSSFGKSKKTVKFSTDIEFKTEDDKPVRSMDKVSLIEEKTRKSSAKKVFTNAKLGKKILRGKKTTFMFFILSLISIASYLPFCVIYVLRDTDWDIYDDIRNALGPWEGVMLSILYVSHAINPIIYGFMDSVFRKDCKMFIDQVKYYVF